MQIQSLLSGCAATAAAIALATSAQAFEKASEPFNYPASLGQGLNGEAGGTGWVAAWSDGDAFPTIASTNLSLEYPTGVLLGTSGGRIELTTEVINNPASRLFDNPINLALSGQTFYSSALFRRSAVAGELTSALFERVSDGVIRWYYGIDANGFFSVAVDPTNGSQRVTSTFQAEADVTYLLVSRIRTNTGASGSDEVFLQVYQEGDIIAEPALDADWDLRASGGSGILLERFRLSMSNATGQTNEFDEFRVGTTFADVAGVPEPGSVSLLALGATLIARRRRR